MKRYGRKWLAFVSAICIFATSVAGGNPGMLAWADDPDPAEPAPVSLEGFDWITTSDFESAGHEEMPEGEYASSGTFTLREKDSFDKTLLTLRATFEGTGYGSRIAFCGTGLEGACFYIYPQKARFVLTQAGAMTSDDAFTPLPIEGTSVSSTTGEEILVQISIEYKDYDGDEVIDGVQLGIYFNGTLSATRDMEHCDMEKFGKNLTITIGTKTISIGKLEEPEIIVPEILPYYAEGFKLITTSSFVKSGAQMADTRRYESTQAYSMRNLQGNTVESFDKSLLSVKVKFEATGINSSLRIAGKDAEKAFAVYTNKSGERLVFTQTSWVDSTRMTVDDPYTAFYAETAGVESFLNHEFILQISFEYGDYDEDGQEDDIRLGFYFDGVLYDNAYKTICNCNMDNFGNTFAVYCYGSGSAPVTVSAVVPGNSDLTELTWSDFQKTGTNQAALDQIVPKTDDENALEVYRLNDSSIANMSDTSYEWQLMFEKGTTKNYVYYAGTGNWRGIKFQARGATGDLWIYPGKPDLGITDVLVFNRDIAGVETFVNREFKLRITTEFADYDGDGDENDVQLGFYFNGKLYNNQYLYSYDCKSDFGNTITLHPETGCISVRSTTDEYEEDIRYVWEDGAYEFAETEDPILVNGEPFSEEALTVPGDYMITVGDATAEKVVLYSEYDPHPDDILDVRDLVATIKVCSGVPVDTWAGNLAVYQAGMDAAPMWEKLLNTLEKEKPNTFTLNGVGGKDVMPIAGYCGPHRAYQDEGRGKTDWYPNFITEEYYQALSEAGINLITYTEENYNFQSGANVKQMLELGSQYGIGHFVTDSKIINRAGVDGCDDIDISGGVATIRGAATLRAASSADLNITNEVTIFMKVKVDTFAGDNVTLLSRGAINSMTYAVGINPSSNNGLWFSNDGYQNSKSGAFPTQEWREVAVVAQYDGSKMNVSYYIANDGNAGITNDCLQLSKSKDNTVGFRASTAPIYIGNYTINGLSETPSVRQYDDIRIYNKALALSQLVGIVPNEEDTDSTVRNALVACWNFENTGEIGSELKDKATAGIKSDDLGIYDANGGRYKQADRTAAALAERMAGYSAYDSFCGVYLVDEPTTDYYRSGDGTKNIANYESLTSVLQDELDTAYFANLFPVWKKSDRAAYERYVEEYCQTLRPRFLSWDNYPFDGNENLDLYFYNMGVVREAAQRYQIPFWATVQAFSPESGSYTQGQFNWNVNTCLAFGVQGIDYYPLIQPIGSSYAPNGAYDYAKSGIIGADGSRNAWYDYAKTINTHIKAIDTVLMNAVNKGVVVNGEQATADTALARGVIEGGEFRQLQSVSGESIVGCFSSNGKTALYVVNYDRASAQSITLNLDAEYHVKVIRNAKTSFTSAQELAFDLAAGEGVLLVIE